MPPKRTRAAGGASKPISASQPEAQRPTRTSNRKRRHSDASNISDFSDISATALKTPAKRRKKGGKVTAETEPDVIIEEREEEMVEGLESETPAPMCARPSEPQAEAEDEEIQVSQSAKQPHVHFQTAESDDFERSTATNLTPHPRGKMTIKRRTLSPNIGGSTKRIKTTRTSLPPALSQENVDPTQLIEDWDFAPLRTVLNEKVRELEARKDTLEEEQDDEAMDEDMLVLDNYRDVTYPQLPTPSQTPIVSVERTAKTESEEESEASRRRSGWAVERKTFQDAILALQKEAEDAKANLKILSIELEALGFAEDSADSLGILQSIRNSFDQTHDFLKSELPGTVPDDATNQDVLEILVANLKEFAGRLRTADKELIEKGTLAADLGNQVHNLVNHLAEKEIKNKQLKQQWDDMDLTNEEKGRAIEELEEELQDVKTERDDYARDLDTEAAKVEDLEEEKQEFEKTIDRLTTSLEQYRTEETRLSELITQMEGQHGETVAAMNREREDTVRDLEDRLDEEIKRRQEAEDLELTIQDLEKEREALQVELETTKAEHDELVDSKEAAEADLEQKQVEVEDLEARVDRLEEQLEEMRGQTETLRQQNETEQTQRVAAEEDLDNRNQEIEDLEQKLRDGGKEANELRMKIYELQTKTTQLERDMSERDEQFQEDMAAEVQRREGADTLAQERAATILDLETRLEEVELQMRNLLAEKDERIAELEEDIAQKDAKIQDLTDDLRNLEESNERVITQNNFRMEELNGSIAALQETIAGHETTIRDLQQEALDNGREADSTIADLNSQIEELETEREKLTNDKIGLERRVSDEAEQMLQIQNDQADQLDELKATIRDKQEKIHTVEEKSREADKRWQDVLDARHEEIAALRTTHKDNISKMKERFKAYVRRSTDTIGHLQQQLDEVKAAADEEGNALKGEGEELLDELEALDVPTEMPVKAMKKTKGRKRVVDSGIGLDGEPVGEGAMIEA